jgi:GTP-binding protein
VANKTDSPDLETMVHEFYELGLSEPIPVSAKQKWGIRTLFSSAIDLLPPADADETDRPIRMKLAVVGKRNAGKSTFINAVVGDERVIVCEVPGTTRDSIDVHFAKNDQHFVVIDTAGIRRKKSVADSIEFYSQNRAERSIRRADVVLLFIDASLPISIVDKKIAESVRSQQKPCIIVVNKWDLARTKNRVTDEYDDYLGKALPGLPYAPISFVTAREGRRVHATLDLAAELFKQAGRWVGTGELNRAIQNAVDRHPPQRKKRFQPKVYYATQVGVHPPTLTLFCNSPSSFSGPYLRYLENTLRDRFDFEEIPIRLVLKARPRRGDPVDP